MLGRLAGDDGRGSRARVDAPEELRGTRPRPREVPGRADRLALARPGRLDDGLRLPEGVPRGGRRGRAGEVRVPEPERHALQLDPRAPGRDRRGRAARPGRGRVGALRARYVAQEYAAA